MTNDIFVGFEREPKAINEFMAQEGYTHVDKTKRCHIYTRPDNQWPQVFYHSRAEKTKADEVPHWQQSRHKIVSEANINFPFSDSDAITEAERLSQKMVKSLDGVLYDSNLDEYFTKDEI